MVTARSIRSPLRCPRYSTLQPASAPGASPRCASAGDTTPAPVSPPLTSPPHWSTRTTGTAGLPRGHCSRTWTRFRRTGASFVKSLFLGDYPAPAQPDPGQAASLASRRPSADGSPAYRTAPHLDLHPRLRLRRPHPLELGQLPAQPPVVLRPHQQIRPSPTGAARQTEVPLVRHRTGRSSSECQPGACPSTRVPVLRSPAGLRFGASGGTGSEADPPAPPPHPPPASRRARQRPIRSGSCGSVPAPGNPHLGEVQMPVPSCRHSRTTSLASASRRPVRRQDILRRYL